MSAQHETTLAAVLMHTTGIMVADLDDAWPLQDFVVGKALWTHERGSANDISAFLLAQFPRLAEAHPPKISTKDEADAWVAEVSAHTGYPLSVTVIRSTEADR